MPLRKHPPNANCTQFDPVLRELKKARLDVEAKLVTTRDRLVDADNARQAKEEVITLKASIAVEDEMRATNGIEAQELTPPPIQHGDQIERASEST